MNWMTIYDNPSIQHQRSLTLHIYTCIYTYHRQAKVLVPPIFIEHDPQIPSRHDLLKVKVGSCSFFIFIRASRIIGPQLKWNKIGQMQQMTVTVWTTIQLNTYDHCASSIKITDQLNIHTIVTHSFRSTSYFCILGLAPGCSGSYKPTDIQAL